MARGDETAKSGETQAVANSQQLNNNAQSIYGQLAPQLMGDVAHPAGYNPSELANMRTDAMETAGGTQAAAVGQGGLMAARTRNAGAPAAAIADSSRRAGQGLSRAALEVSTNNADLKQKQRQSALAGLSGLFGANIGGATGNLNAGANLSNADTNAENASWNWTKAVTPFVEGASKIAAARFGG